MNALTHLHIHSEFSLSDSILRVGEIVDFAKSQGAEAIALTDHDGFYGVVRFAEAAQALAPQGRFIIYGPFLRDGRATSDGDARFDAAIRADHPEAGYKNDADMLRWAGDSGLDVVARTEMPANNLALVMVRSKDTA